MKFMGAWLMMGCACFFRRPGTSLRGYLEAAVTELSEITVASYEFIEELRDRLSII